MKVSESPRVDLHYADCIQGMAERLAPESVDLVVTSIPFEELFTYSGKPEDVGNNGSTVDIRAGRFALNMRFVVDAAFRVMRPGTNFCCHIQQLLAYKVQHGFMGRRDFRGAVIEVFTAGGFQFQGEAAERGPVDAVTADELRGLADLYAGRDRDLTHALARRLGLPLPSEVVVPKNPQAMSQRLNLHSLQFKTGYARDSSLLAPAPNDYVLIFRKPGRHPSPPKAITYKGRNPGGWVTEEEWIAWASGVWADVLEIDVLDGSRSKAHKEDGHEKHVCPLQLEVIRRCVALYTNPVSVQPDVTVLDPFMGIGSTAYVCAGGASPTTKLKLAEPRNVVGFELKESYHRASVAYVGAVLEAARKPPAPRSLLDVLKAEAEAAPAHPAPEPSWRALDLSHLDLSEEVETPVREVLGDPATLDAHDVNDLKGLVRDAADDPPPADEPPPLPWPDRPASSLGLPALDAFVNAQPAGGPRTLAVVRDWLRGGSFAEPFRSEVQAALMAAGATAADVDHVPTEPAAKKRKAVRK